MCTPKNCPKITKCWPKLLIINVVILHFPEIISLKARQLSTYGCGGVVYTSVIIVWALFKHDLEYVYRNFFRFLGRLILLTGSE